MTDPEVEDLLRDTFRARETQAPPLSRVRPKPRRPRPATWIGAGIATLAVLGGAIYAAGTLRGPNPSIVDANPPGSLADDASGWRWESSLGAEIQVPDSWTVNQNGCGTMSDKPTVVRGEGVARECLPIEPPTKTVAILSTPDGLDSRLPTHSRPLWTVTVDGVPGRRAEDRLDDGRFVGQIVFPDRQVAVAVRTPDADLGRRILDSVRLVAVDHLGCETHPSAALALPGANPGALTLPAQTRRIVLCNYAATATLQSSAVLTDSGAQAVVDALRTAQPGGNPDPLQAECLAVPQQQPDLVLRPDSGPPLSVAFSGCTRRGATDGEHTVRVSDPLIAMLMKPLYSGWSTSAPLQ